MFEVIVFGDGETTYQGDNWLHALAAYEAASQPGNHVVLWEGSTPAREYHPEKGHLDIN